MEKLRVKIYSSIFEIDFWRLNLCETNLYYNESFSISWVRDLWSLLVLFRTECKLLSLCKSIFHFQTLSFYSPFIYSTLVNRGDVDTTGIIFFLADKELKSIIFFSLFVKLAGWPFPSGLRLDLYSSTIVIMGQPISHREITKTLNSSWICVMYFESQEFHFFFLIDKACSF